MKISVYDIARQEANEVRVVLRRLVQKGLLAQSDIARAYNLAGACMAMLTSAIRAQEARAAAQHPPESRAERQSSPNPSDSPDP